MVLIVLLKPFPVIPCLPVNLVILCWPERKKAINFYKLADEHILVIGKPVLTAPFQMYHCQDKRTKCDIVLTVYVGMSLIHVL